MKAAIASYLSFLLLFFPIALSESPPGHNAVQLSTVQTLTLHAHRMAWYRRVPPIEQLKCIGPTSVCKLYEVDTMRCTNQGYDYDPEDIQWSCTAELPPEFKLGSTDVICEGYRNADDKWILKGSCGVEYRLLLTEKGEERYGRHKLKSSRENSSQNDGSAGPLVGLFLILILAFILYSMCFGDRTERRQDANRGWPWGGGGGGGNDPPPPYDYQPRSQPKRSEPSSGPGFWTGAASGAAVGSAAGYAMGSRRNRQQAEREARAGPSYSYGSSSHHDLDLDEPSPSRNFSSTRTSTGFGSTRRR